MGATVNLLTGSAIDGQDGTDTLTAIENVRATGFADTLTGDGRRDVLRGAEANDTLDGGGNNELHGDAGSDTVNAAP